MCKPIFVSNPTELGKVMLWLELSWGCDNFEYDAISQTLLTFQLPVHNFEGEKIFDTKGNDASWAVKPNSLHLFSNSDI